MLKVLPENGLFLNVYKTIFAQSNLKFLGIVIGVDGIDVQSSKVAAIREYPMPITRKNLRRLIGTVNYYHAFVPKLAEVTLPLCRISGSLKKTNKAILKLDDIQVKAFENTKVALANTASLSFENLMKPLYCSPMYQTLMSVQHWSKKGKRCP